MNETKTTAFCVTEVPLWDDLRFYIDGNSKVTAENGTFEDPVPNAFSLPHISTCPGSTESCRKSCYVHGLEENAHDIYRLYSLNAMALNRILMATGSMKRSARMLSDWIRKTGLSSFRWHVSGDVMSERHAQWIRMVSEQTPDTLFWIYTRSFEHTYSLSGLENLVANLSADQDNYERALHFASLYENKRICYFTSDGTYPGDLPADSVIFPDYALRGRDLEKPTEAEWWKGLDHSTKKKVCPADFFGQSKGHRCGPCKKCMKQFKK